MCWICMRNARRSFYLAKVKNRMEKEQIDKRAIDDILQKSCILNLFEEGELSLPS